MSQGSLVESWRDLVIQRCGHDAWLAVLETANPHSLYPWFGEFGDLSESETQRLVEQALSALHRKWAKRFCAPVCSKGPELEFEWKGATIVQVSYRSHRSLGDFFAALLETVAGEALGARVRRLPKLGVVLEMPIGPIRRIKAPEPTPNTRRSGFYPTTETSQGEGGEAAEALRRTKRGRKAGAQRTSRARA